MPTIMNNNHGCADAPSNKSCNTKQEFTEANLDVAKIAVKPEESIPTTINLIEIKSEYENLETHTGEKPFKCAASACEHRSGQKFHVTKHDSEKKDYENAEAFPCNNGSIKQELSEDDSNPFTASTAEQDQTITIDQAECAIPDSKPNEVFIRTQNSLDEEFDIKDEIPDETVPNSKKARYQCPQCNYKTAYRSNFARHTRTHTGEKPYNCDECQYKTSSQSDLSRHVKSHTGEKPFECKTCGYKTIRKYDLTNHMRVHTGEKPFKCNLCEFKTFLKASLVGHKKVHTREKPFECEVCGLKASHKSNLVQHMKIHTGEKPFKCKISGCDHSTVRKSDLEKHMKTHNEENKSRIKKLDNESASVFYCKEEPESLQSGK